MIDGSSASESCVFCRESLEPTYANLFLGPKWPYEGRILFATEKIFLIPGYGPQVYPYLLVVTRRHITSLAQTSPEERDEILASLRCLLASSLFECDSLFVFEHAGCQNIEACIEHFHLHVVSGSYDLTSALDEFPTKTRELRPTVSFPDDSSYLLAFKVTQKGRVFATFATTREKRDQFFRKALARRIGEEAWDWRTDMNRDFMVRLMEESGGLGLTMSKCMARQGLGK